MKMNLRKKTLWQFLASVFVLVIMLLLAVGSISTGPQVEIEHLGDGVYEESTYYEDEDITITTGKRDEYGRWDGAVKIIQKGRWGYMYTEEVNMVDGKRHGLSTSTFKSGTVLRSCYNMGIKVDCQKGTQALGESPSAFQLLNEKYPWNLYVFNAFGFDNTYVESYLDTLETVLKAFEFEQNEFDDFFSDAIADLEDTPYDSIIVASGGIYFSHGRERSKDSELRLAVLDAYNMAESNTFDIIKKTYPGYLATMSELGANETDFEGFCHDLDSCMKSFTPLDVGDPLFIDSIDMRLLVSIINIFDGEDSKSLKVPLQKEAIYREVTAFLGRSSLNLAPDEVATLVLGDILVQYDRAHLVKRVVRDAYNIRNEVVTVPTVSTEFLSHNSSTSVTLQGSVLEDGGAEVLSRGVAWGQIYNPTFTDHAEPGGTGTGTFATTINGLTEGSLYYARTYATNDSGTAYGNCISFIVSSNVGISEDLVKNHDLQVYPNPASESATFRFHVETSEAVLLSITDLNGRVLLQQNPGNLQIGENLIVVDVTGLKSGVYSCMITDGSARSSLCKLVIAH